MIIDIYIDIDRVIFEVFKLQNEKKINIIKDKLIFPKSFSIIDKLRYIRRFMKTLIQTYNINKSYINLSDCEHIDSGKFETIIEEVLSDCGVILCK